MESLVPGALRVPADALWTVHSWTPTVFCRRVSNGIAFPGKDSVLGWREAQRRSFFGLSYDQ